VHTLKVVFLNFSTTMPTRDDVTNLSTAFNELQITEKVYEL